MASKAIPSYRKQKSKSGDRAFVEIGGTRHYLGAFGSDESRERYARVIAEWAATGRAGSPDPNEITIGEVVSVFWAWCERYYAKPNSDTTSEVDMFRLAFRPLVALYGRTKATEFGPLRLRAVRQKMIDGGLTRGYINKQTGRLVRMFKWAAAEEMIPSSVYHGLQTVAGLKRGRTEARESEGVKPVPDSIVDATLPHMTPTLRAMVQVQRLTGMRPGELVIMRTGDLDMSGPVWTYQPKYHKTQYRGRARQAFLGPRSQEIIRPFLRHDLQAYMFQPLQSERERREAMHAERKTPMSCGNRPGSNRKAHPKWGPKDRYRTETYGKAIEYACRRAFPAPDDATGDALTAWRREHRWTPLQIRHRFATDIRRVHGLEAAQILLGHARADVTQVYAERDTAKALAVAAQVG